MVLAIVAATYSSPAVLVHILGYHWHLSGRGVQTRGKGMARALRCRCGRRYETLLDAGILVGLGRWFCR